MDGLAIAIYVRGSTTGQDLRAQEPELKAWAEANAGDGEVAWYRDKHTGRSMDRPAINLLERDIEAGKIGTISSFEGAVEAFPKRLPGEAFESEARIQRAEREEAAVSLLGPSRRCCLSEPSLDGE